MSYPVGTAPQAVASGDFNADGKMDLAVANSGNPAIGDDGNVSILLGNGDGTFQSASNIAAGKNPFAIAAADFDGDGRADLVVIDSFGVGVLLGNGNGDGTFQTAVVYRSGGGIARSVAVGDVNRDGKPDLLVANPCYTGGNCANSTVGVLLGNGDGTFQTAVVYGSGGPIARSVAVGDVNGDGKMDLISCSPAAHILVLLGNGDGTFQSVISSQGPFYCNQVVVADFNQDGKPDVAVGVGPVPFSGNFGVVVILGNGDGTFQPPSTDLPVGSVVVADFNGDNKPDLLGAAQGGSVSLSLGNGDGTFQAPSSFAPAGTGSPMAADLNHDKAPDLVVTNVNNNTISVLLNTTGADFSISA